MDVEQLQAELLDLGQDPVQRCLVGQRPGEHGLTSLDLRVQTRECHRMSGWTARRYPSARQTPRLAKSWTLRRAGGLSGPGRFSRTV